MNSVQESLGTQIAALNRRFDGRPILACTLSKRVPQIEEDNVGNNNQYE